MGRPYADVVESARQVGGVTQTTVTTHRFEISITGDGYQVGPTDTIELVLNGRTIKRMSRWQAEHYGILPRTIEGS